MVTELVDEDEKFVELVDEDEKFVELVVFPELFVGFPAWGPLTKVIITLSTVGPILSEESTWYPRKHKVLFELITAGSRCVWWTYVPEVELPVIILKMIKPFHFTVKLDVCNSQL